MAKFPSEFSTYVGISNCTYTDGLHPNITAAIPEFNPYDECNIREAPIYQAETEDPLTGTSSGTSKVKKVRTVFCTYFGSPVNGLYPCVQRGERVLVINYAGTEQYYWMQWGRDMGLRAHERIRWFAMDKPIAVDDPPEYEDASERNSYFIEFNTNKGDKGFRIHTGVNDGETYAYDICIFPEKSMFEITDNMAGGGCKSPIMSCDCDKDKGNCIRLNSAERRWRIWNVNGSYVEIDKNNITLSCSGTITLSASNIVLFASNNMTSVTGKKRMETVGESSTFTCPEQKVTGAYRNTNISGADIKSATVITQIANGAMIQKGTACSNNFGAIVNTGNHFFTGNSFIVGTGSGCVPMPVLIGANCW